MLSRVFVACVHAHAGHFPRELCNGSEGKALGSGFHLGSPWQWAGHSGSVFGSMCVSHTPRIQAGECNVSFLNIYIIILLFCWKFHTGINRASRSSPGC